MIRASTSRPALGESIKTAAAIEALPHVITSLMATRNIARVMRCKKLSVQLRKKSFAVARFDWSGTEESDSKLNRRPHFDGVACFICWMLDVASPNEFDETGHAPLAACADRTRRSLLSAVLGAGACLAARRSAGAEEGQAGSDERPQTGDLLVFAQGPQSGQVIKPSDLKLGGPFLRAWPKDSKTSVVRSGARLNDIVLVKLDPAELDDATRAHAADGIVAYSAVCTHAGCPVTAWVKGEGSDKNVLKCMCHNSEYDPRTSGQVVFGPAPRRLAALPLTVSGDSLAVAAPFAGKVGVQQSG